MKNIFFCFALIILLCACRDQAQVDVKNPVINSLSVNGIQNDEHTFEASSVLTISVALSDNTDLNQVQINLHAAEDGHTHNGEGSDGGEYRLNAGKWTFSDIVNISGKSATQTWTLEVPDSIAGTWHVEISLLDDVGYTAIPFATTIHITNPNLPVVTGNTVPMPDTGGLVHLTSAINLSVSGLATDPDKLSRFFVHLDGTNFSDTMEIPIVGIGTSMAFNDQTFDEPNTGNYRVVIEAIDSLGYRGIWDARIKVE